MAQRGRERFHSPAVKVDFVDPVGAGDSFDAGFLSQYVRGADLPPACPSETWRSVFDHDGGRNEAFRDRKKWADFSKAAVAK